MLRNSGSGRLMANGDYWGLYFLFILSIFMPLICHSPWRVSSMYAKPENWEGVFRFENPRRRSTNYPSVLPDWDNLGSNASNLMKPPAAKPCLTSIWLQLVDVVLGLYTHLPPAARSINQSSPDQINLLVINIKTRVNLGKMLGFFLHGANTSCNKHAPQCS